MADIVADEAARTNGSVGYARLLVWSIARGVTTDEGQEDGGVAIDRSIPFHILKWAALGTVAVLIGVAIVHGIGLPSACDGGPTEGKWQQGKPQQGKPQQGKPHQGSPQGAQKGGQSADGEGFHWQQDLPETLDKGTFGFGYDKLCGLFRDPSPLGDPEQEALRRSIKRQCGYVNEARASWHLVDRVIETMGIQPGDVIADIGCASGFHTYYLSEATGPRGRVYAVDLDRVAVAFLAGRITSGVFKYDNVTPLMSKPSSVLLPEESLDWAFLCGVHFFARPGRETDRCVASLFEAVKPGGHVASIDSTAHVEFDEITADYLKAGFEIESVHDFLLEGGPGRPEDHPPEHFVIYKRPDS